jgi:ubiquinone/menaquinone biosynthesis C-methylase UbiE
MNIIESYYDINAQNEWERFDRHRMEFAITRRALAQCLPPPPARILDCGGGPGRYAIHLAQQGYQVSLLDLAQGNLNLAQVKAAEAGVEIVDFIHGNALDLSRFPDAKFDAVLLLGPLYHLLTHEERCQAVQEAVRVLKPGGPLLAGFITLYAPFRDAIAKGYLKEFAENSALLAHLLGSQAQTADSGFTEAWFARPSDACPLMEACGLETKSLLAVEGLAAGHEQHLNALDDASFELWVDLNFRFCPEPSLLGAADHLLYIGSKPTAL